MSWTRVHGPDREPLRSPRVVFGPSSPVRVLTWSSFFIFVLGFLTAFKVDLVGVVYIGELLLAIVAFWAVFANAQNPRFWDRAFALPLFLMCLTFFGYILSDFVNGSTLENSLRGWARMAFMISDFFALTYLFRTKPMRLLVFCLGFGFGLAAYPSTETLLTSYYKLAIALPLTLLAVCGGALLKSRARYVLISLGLAAAGILHFFMDFRSLGAICLAASAIVFTKSSEKTRLRACYLILLGGALVGGAGTLYWSLTSSAERYAARRSESNSLRLADYEAIVIASSRSPFIGAGSWATSSEIMSLMSGSLTQSAGRRKRTNELAELPGHSQLLQVWYEAGLLGLSFFVFLTFKLMRAIWFCIFHAPLSPLFPLTLVYSIFSFWHVLFSPFAGAHRVHIAISAVVLIILARGHRVPQSIVTFVPHGAEPPFQPDRSLAPA